MARGHVSGAELAVSEARIGYARAKNEDAGVIVELGKMVQISEKSFDQARMLHTKGFVSDGELLKSEEAVLEAKIRLAEAKIGAVN